jgi:hypothetical protein
MMVNNRVGFHPKRHSSLKAGFKIMHESGTENMKEERGKAS